MNECNSIEAIDKTILSEQKTSIFSATTGIVKKLPNIARKKKEKA